MDTLLKAAATEADSFIHQATENLKEAKNYYRKATRNEEFYRQKLEDEEKILNKRNREVWMAEQRYNSSCELEDCKKSRLFFPRVGRVKLGQKAEAAILSKHDSNAKEKCLLKKEFPLF